MTAGRSDALRLADMMQSIDRIDQIREGGYDSFSSSWQPQSAAIRELELIGEAAGAVSSATRTRHPEVEWNRLRGFSSFAKHEYWKIDPLRLWKAIVEMPDLRRKVSGVVDDV